MSVQKKDFIQEDTQNSVLTSEFRKSVTNFSLSRRGFTKERTTTFNYYQVSSKGLNKVTLRGKMRLKTMCTFYSIILTLTNKDGKSNVPYQVWTHKSSPCFTDVLQDNIRNESLPKIYLESTIAGFSLNK